MAKLKIAGVINESIVDGKGIRFVVFVQGCPHHCEGCHNPETHDFAGGQEIDTDDIVEQIKKDPLLSGVTFSGGEPFCQPAELAELGGEIVKLGLDITTYTGYRFEDLMEMKEKNPAIGTLLGLTDILIDGKFEIGQKSLLLKFRGSENQRILDAKASLEQGRAVETEL